MKSEGLAILPYPYGDKTRLVIVYDNDPNGGKRIPSKMECLELSNDLKVSRVKC